MDPHRLGQVVVGSHKHMVVMKELVMGVEMVKVVVNKQLVLV